MQSRAEITRTRLLDAARRCFAEHGYAVTGVADICTQAGVSKGAFYHHFPSKQAPFLALLDEWLQTLDAQMARARAGADAAPAALLNAAGMFAQVFADAAGQLPMFLEFWSQAARDPAVWAATISPYRRYHALFREWVEAGVAEGSLRQVDAGAAAHVLVALALGLLLQSLVDAEGADWGAVGQEGMRLLLDGLERRTL